MPGMRIAVRSTARCTAYIISLALSVLPWGGYTPTSRLCVSRYMSLPPFVNLPCTSSGYAATKLCSAA
eukprot:148444-Rhodomonas_salina.4